MPAKVSLTVTRGVLTGKTFIFQERTTCILGRADECLPQIPNDDQHKTISRHHCLLDINPPDIRVRDFGSLNGTYVNGKKIGQRAKGQTPEEAAQHDFPEYDLTDGDTITLGNTIFQVTLFVPVLCAECGAEIPEAEQAQAERAPGVYQCAACRRKAEQAHRKTPSRPRPKVCATCGKDIARELGANRHGELLCATCRADPRKVVELLLLLANQGEAGLEALAGYRLVRELGRGGMGSVSLIRHERLGEEIALKIMLPRVAADERAKALFLRETENTKALKHPHVVQVRDSGCAHGVFFFTLEYCNRGSVRDLQEQRRGPLSVQEACALIVQALDGLHYAHHAAIPAVKLADGSYGTGQGLVHRDVKPGNLFLVGTGSARLVKLGDYGLAKAFDAAGLSGQTSTGAISGTPGFMPRQQVINFKFAKPEVDVWAMAASLYQVLTGTFPREFPKGKDPWMQVLQTDAVPIRKRNAAIPKRLAQVVDHALVDQPEIGFKTALAFKQALEGVL